MIVGNTNIDKTMMPSYDDFTKSPDHLYQRKQERLRGLLSTGQMPLPLQQPGQGQVQSVSQSERWANESK